jgi:serine/threonine protein kinase
MGAAHSAKPARRSVHRPPHHASRGKAGPARSAVPVGESIMLARKGMRMFSEFYEMVEGERSHASLHIPTEDARALSAEDAQVIHDFRTRYEWNDDDCLGKGANGAVFRVKSRADGTPFALKITLKDGMAEVDCEDLRSEFEIHAECSGHPNVIHLVEWHETSSQFLCVCEMAPTNMLKSLVSRHGRYTEAMVADIVAGCAAGLAHCHEVGIAHFDIKPDNILIAADGRAMLTDFGLAEAVPTARTVATAFFIAPEILRCKELWQEGREAPIVDTPADCWALGVMCYILLCGYPPFMGRHLNHDVARGRFKFHSPGWDSVSNEAKSFVRELLNVNPNARLTAAAVASHPWITHFAAKNDVTHLEHAHMNLYDHHERFGRFHHAVHEVALRGRGVASFRSR